MSSSRIELLRSRIRSDPALAACITLFLTAAIFSIYVHLTVELFPEDDAYITYRYVHNLVNGDGLVYNLGQRVMGSTTPLYVFWLAILKELLPWDVPELSVRLNFVWYVLSVVPIALLINTISGKKWLGWLGAAVLLISWGQIRTSIGGMESYLFAALALWSVERLVKHQFLQAAFLASLCLVTRPEGLLVVGICAVAWLFRSRQDGWRFGLALVGPALVWFVFAILYFGTPIPHSVVAKSAGLYPLPPGDAIKTILLDLNDWVLVLKTSSNSINTVAAAFLGILAGFAFLRFSRSKTSSMLIACLFVLMLSFYAITNPAMFGWYMPIIRMLYFCIVFAGAFLGISSILTRLFRGFANDSAPQAGNARLEPVGAIVTVILVIGYFGLLTASRYSSLTDGTATSLTSLFISGSTLRVATYSEAAKWLNANWTADARIAAPEIGALGYYWKGSILDAAGLVSPEAIPFLPAPAEERDSPWHGVIPKAFVRSTEPELVVTHPFFARKSLLIDPWFNEHYEQVRTFRLLTRLWGADEILVFEKKAQ